MEDLNNIRPAVRFPLPARFDYYLHCAQTWKGIFTKLHTNRTGILYDLCCGWSPKIELALTGMHFRGKLYAIDRSTSSLAVHRQFTSIVPPQFTIRYRACDILRSPILRIPKADIIVGNHILDDLLLNYYCDNKHTDVNRLFSHPGRLKRVWVDLLKQPQYRDYVFHQASRFISRLLADHGLVILTHYAGYQERLYGYPEDMNAYTGLLEYFKTTLLESGTYRDRSAAASKIIKQIRNPYFSSDSILFVETI